VFVVFFAPWCGHCRKLEPTLNAVARNSESVKTLVIGKFDATQNDVTGLFFSGYPTLMLFPSGKKDEPVTYHGERSTEKILEFIASHCTHKFNAADVLHPPEKKATESHAFIIEEL